MKGAPLELIADDIDVPDEILSRMNEVAAVCLRIEGVSGADACAHIVGDDEIKRLNRVMRGIDSATDVLSFPSVEYRGKTAGECLERIKRERNPETRRAFLGDFAISIRAAERQAISYGHSLEREVGYLTAHAMFHLMGYDHEREEDARAMRAMEKRAMADIALYREESMDKKNYTDEELIGMAREAMNAAYAPYSHFRVGACLLSSDGRVFTGCNIENASYGLSICAERAAAARAVADGARRFQKIAVTSDSGEAWPCGACRQVLSEFSDNMIVLCAREGASPVSVPLAELLPRAFSLREEE